MVERLAERFIKADGAPIEVDGKLVHMMFELPPIRRSTELRVQLKTDSERPQGLHMKARGGKLDINDQVADDVILWSDTAPGTVMAGMRPRSPSKPMAVRVWNAWREPEGTISAWTGDAGIVVEERAPGDVVLHCSDGVGAPTFDDLVVALEFDAGD